MQRVSQSDANVPSAIHQPPSIAHHHSRNFILSMAPAAPQLSHLSNPLATPEQLVSSGSQLDGIPSDLEDSIRYASVRLTQAAGILLRLPQDIIAQAIVTFTRFWI